MKRVREKKIDKHAASMKKSNKKRSDKKSVRKFKLALKSANARENWVPMPDNVASLVQFAANSCVPYDVTLCYANFVELLFSSYHHLHEHRSVHPKFSAILWTGTLNKWVKLKYTTAFLDEFEDCKFHHPAAKWITVNLLRSIRN